MSLPLNVFWCRAHVFASFFFQFLQILAIYNFFLPPFNSTNINATFHRWTYVKHIHYALKHQYHRPPGSESEIPQSFTTLGDPMDCNLRGSSVHGIFQARILEWIAISFSRRSSRPRGSNPGLPHCGQTLYRLSHQGEVDSFWFYFSPGGSLCEAIGLLIPSSFSFREYNDSWAYCSTLVAGPELQGNRSGGGDRKGRELPSCPAVTLTFKEKSFAVSFLGIA